MILKSIEASEIELFPYKPRKFQREIVLAIRESLESGTPLVLESGTGSGKTVCAVSQALKFSIENGKKIIYITRTNAQQRQVITEVRNIRDRFLEFKEEIFAVGVQTLGVAHRRSHRLDTGPDDVVVGVLGGQGPARGL